MNKILATWLSAVFCVSWGAPVAKAQENAQAVVQTAGFQSNESSPKDQLAEPVNDLAVEPLLSSVHPNARPKNDAGRVPLGLPIARMTLVLRRSAGQQAELDTLVAAQQDPKSPEFHKWLTPEEYGARFGLTQSDLDKLTTWLKQGGFAVDEIPNGRWTIVFSGTAGQVETAFHTELHYYKVSGVAHRANATPLQIPKAFAPAVEGVLGVHDFHPVPLARPKRRPNLLAGDGNHYLSPSDYATIYDLNPLYSSGIDGTGQTIAIVGRCAIDPAVVAAFRSQTGLPANNPTITIAGQTPAACTGAELSEPYLDVEWAGAVAKNAKIVLVVASNIADAATYIINNNVAPVMSTSFGNCEQNVGSAGSQFWSNLWQQAASHGITSLVSSGDSGAAGCNTGDTEFAAASDRGVNAICSTPYNTCVGGTELNDFSNPSQFWSAAGKALGYISEEAWNESGNVPFGDGLWATGGGYSLIYPKSMAPWQTGNTTAFRGVPDVSLPAAIHDGYLISESIGDLGIEGGTSAAAPSFAGMMALVVQKTGSRQGSANTALYALASRSDVFHDVVLGNNSVPGVTGYSAGPGWDAVTGLGSVDANSLVTHWGSSSTSAPSVLLSTSNLNFGTQAVGTTSAAQTLTMSNAGNATLNVASVKLTGANPADFPSTSNCPGTTAAGTLAPGQNCNLTVTFKPSALGARTALIAITDDAGGSPQTLSLSGTGTSAPVPPTVSLALTSSTTGIVNGSCVTPASAGAFTTTSPYVWLYYVLNNANLNDTYRMSFTRPDGVNYSNLTATNTYGTSVCFSYYIGLSGYAAASYPGKWTVQTFWNQSTTPLFALTFTVAAPSSSAPFINANGVVNNASQVDGLTSGGFISIYGTNLSSSSSPQYWNVVGGKLGTITAGTQVLINGKLAYPYYVSPTLINALAPVDSAFGPVTVQVITSNGASAPVTVTKKTVAPALFMFSQGGNRYAVATLPDGVYPIPPNLIAGALARAARPGDVVALWATGLGSTNPAIPDGQVVTVANRGVLTSSYSLTVGGKPATIQYAGLVQAGVYQVNFVVPQLPPGDASVLLTVAGVPTQTTANIYIGQ